MWETVKSSTKAAIAARPHTMPPRTAPYRTAPNVTHRALTHYTNIFESNEIKRAEIIILPTAGT